MNLLRQVSELPFHFGVAAALDQGAPGAASRVDEFFVPAPQ